MICLECQLVLDIINRNGDWEEFPDWYKKGLACPKCGAIYVNEFGKGPNKAKRLGDVIAEAILKEGSCSHVGDA